MAVVVSAVTAQQHSPVPFCTCTTAHISYFEAQLTCHLICATFPNAAPARQGGSLDPQQPWVELLPTEAEIQGQRLETRPQLLRSPLPGTEPGTWEVHSMWTQVPAWAEPKGMNISRG